MTKEFQCFYEYVNMHYFISFFLIILITESLEFAYKNVISKSINIKTGHWLTDDNVLKQSLQMLRLNTMPYATTNYWFCPSSPALRRVTGTMMMVFAHAGFSSSMMW